MCDHERLKTIGDRVFCCICKAELPLEFLINQGKPAEHEPEATEQVPGDQNQAENQADGKKPGKTPGRKKAAKTAV